MAAMSSNQPRNGVSASPPSSPTTPCKGSAVSMVSRRRNGTADVGTERPASGTDIAREADTEPAGEQPRSP